ncbi:VOC family protein [Pseudonocardia sp. N23]|uniref:VOC family protein n=1 Tax=Pseudonocardia sp. N23 TaxID=1987376 RepID=UPI000BFC5047|nr:VOC family protein [Pseudonocardia sp. N23]GAY10394.1 hypothetical protein TOK_4754 [Pseudonocardia sp. N23]
MTGPNPRPRLSVVALDCPDAEALVRFYSELTGWPVAADSEDDWWELVAEGPVTIACQVVDGYRAPVWPSQEHPQQVHLDFDVPDLDAGEAFVLGIGATKAGVQPGETFRVYLDPVGHPFCLVLAK